MQIAGLGFEPRRLALAQITAPNSACGHASSQGLAGGGSSGALC